MQGIATYKQTDYKVEEITSKVQQDRQGNPVWAPYSEANLSEFNNIIQQCERDWFRKGVTDYRIKNRITTMKLFYDTWDMNKLYSHIKTGNFRLPKYAPLSDQEMTVITQSIKKHRKQGDDYRQITEKCLKDWDASFREERDSATSSDDIAIGQLLFELYENIYERQPTDRETEDNINLFRIYLEKLDRQQAIGKLIESLILSTEFAYRNEFGEGKSDEFGRRMMSPRNASYAIAYALTDTSPDDELTEAVNEGKLTTREDYERDSSDSRPPRRLEYH